MVERGYSQSEKDKHFKGDDFNEFPEQIGDQLLDGLWSTESTDHMVTQTISQSQSQSTDQTPICQLEQGLIDCTLLGELEESQSSDYPLPPEGHCEAEQSEIGFSRRSLKDTCDRTQVSQSQSIEQTPIYSSELGESLLGKLKDCRSSDHPLPFEEHCEIGFSRRSLKHTCPLALFFFKQGKPPKHEYYVVMIIRALKKAIRTLLSSKDYPQGGVFIVLLEDNLSTIELWKEFCRIVQPWLQILALVAKTEAGPATDGKAKRREESATHSSFNKRYIKDFYSSPYVRVAHFLFTETIFSADLSTLCSAMKFSCCEGTHSAACNEKWKALKAYTQKNIIEEVGLEPYLGT